MSLKLSDLAMVSIVVTAFVSANAMFVTHF